MKEKSKKKKAISQTDFKEALIKKAIGYDTTEIVEEYVSGDEGDIKLTKKKVTKKNVPPDLSALKLLLDSENVSLDSMSDEELEREKQRLLELLSDIA
jgi:hypothetical protein